MPHVSGFLHVNELGASIDNSLPGGGYPSHGLPPFQGGPDNSLPLPPPGVWPPPTPGNPIVPVRPDQGLPSSPGHPSQGLPSSPGHPDNTLPGGGASNKPVPPLPPGMIWPPVQGGSGKYLCLVIIPGIGWRYTVIDTSLKPSNELPGSGEYPSGQPVPPPSTTPPPAPDNTLPPTPQPKK